MPRNVGPFFKQENYDVLNDPRVQIVYDDARHYILTSKEKFDIITSDPIHPWVKGAANLYTQEYFELAKKRLNPGGSSRNGFRFMRARAPTVKSELGTFFNALPGGHCLGQQSKRENVRSRRVRLSRPDADQLGRDE